MTDAEYEKVQTDARAMLPIIAQAFPDLAICLLVWEPLASGTGRLHFSSNLVDKVHLVPACRAVLDEVEPPRIILLNGPLQ